VGIADPDPPGPLAGRSGWGGVWWGRGGMARGREAPGRQAEEEGEADEKRAAHLS